MQSLINNITKFFEKKIDSESTTDWAIVRFNCSIHFYVLVGLTTVICLIMLININNYEHTTYYITTRVLKEAYWLIITTIIPQIVLVSIFGILSTKFRGELPIKKVVINLLALSFLNFLCLFGILYLKWYTSKSYENIIILTAFVCPLISFVVSEIAEKREKKNKTII